MSQLKSQIFSCKHRTICYKSNLGSSQRGIFALPWRLLVVVHLGNWNVIMLFSKGTGATVLLDPVALQFCNCAYEDINWKSLKQFACNNGHGCSWPWLLVRWMGKCAQLHFIYNRITFYISFSRWKNVLQFYFPIIKLMTV